MLILLFNLLIAFLCFVFVSSEPTYPMWGGNPHYSVTVNMSYPAHSWTFNYFYDSRINASRYEHLQGQYDELCTEFPYPQKQCNVIFAPNHWMYIQYPEENFCCKCLNSFGAVRYDAWEGSEYEGIEMVHGKRCQHWTKKGRVLTHYYVEDTEEQLPVRFYEYWISPPGPKSWDFYEETYTTKEFDPSLVRPPMDCENLCTNKICVSHRV